MNDTTKTGQKKRMEQIEDRKIEILMEIARLNKDYDNKVSGLNSEYEKLHKELYMLQIKMIGGNN